MKQGQVSFGKDTEYHRVGLHGKESERTSFEVCGNAPKGRKIQEIKGSWSDFFCVQRQLC